MKCVYFDSSAIVKLVRTEAETVALLDYLETPFEAVTSSVSEIEVRRALQRERNDSAEAAEALSGFYVIELHATIRRKAAMLEPQSLRSLDAVHLATALSLDDPDLEVVTYDDRLAAAARAQGMRVVQPGHRLDTE